MAKKTEKCKYALGQCTAASNDECPKKRNRRIMTGLCFKVPVKEGGV